MKNLKDYILHLDNWIPKKICNKSIKELSEDKTWEQHQYHNPKEPNKLYTENGEREPNVCHGDNLTHFNDLYNLTWKALEKYIVIEKIGGEGFAGWEGFSKIRFNRYKKNQIMSKHFDHIHNIFSGDVKGIPILSIVGVLNNDYEGGEFIMFDDYEIKFKPGDLILFPSVFLYPHLVKPVTKGTRYSFVSWSW